MYIVQGTRLTWVGDFAAGTFLSAFSVDAVNQAGAYLKNNYSLIIEDSHESNESIFGHLGAGTITLNLRTDIDRGDLEDVRGNVMEAFSAIGINFASSRIIDYKSPGAIVKTNTGAEADNSQADSSNGSPLGWFDKLKMQIEAGSIGFVVGVVVIVGVGIYIAVKP